MSVSSSHKKELKRLRLLRTYRWFLSAIGLIIIGIGLYSAIDLFLNFKRNEVTNDAQVEQYVSPINVKVPGYIQKIFFTEHQFVKEGDTLLIIDDSEYKIKVMEAEAALKDALSGANVLDATLVTAFNSVSVYDASIAELEAKIAKLKKDYERYQNLLQRDATTPIQVEQIKTELDMTLARRDALHKQKTTASSSANEVITRKGNTEAAILRAQANLAMARLNLSYSLITAPTDGYLGRRTIEEGQLVNAGQTITYIIPNSQKWIVANYKETQVENLYIGQEVEIKIDAIKERKYKGYITAISDATGSRYSLVPADNSTGNFIKIQQRIPVRIDFDSLSGEDSKRMAVGMMAEVKAKTKK